MKKQQASSNSRLAAIEINSTGLHVCVSSREGDAPWMCETRSVEWRVEAASLNSERGQLEMTEALRRVSSDLKLSGARTWICLTGAYCVTRVATGDEEQVRTELARLEERSELYLSLGHGPKSLAASVHAVDARRRHALLSVVNQRTLDTLVTAANKAGLKLQRMESALVSLSRLVASMRAPDSPPAMVLSVDERGVEVGISHGGLLVLDYRPAAANNPEQIAATLLRHLGRLRRYCQRHIGFAEGQLSDVYLLGPPEAVGALRTALEGQDELTTYDLLNPWSSLKNWQGDDGCPSWTMGGPIGLSMLRDDTLGGCSPNLLERMQAETREPLVKVLRPLLVPLAATLVAIAIGWVVVSFQRSRCHQLEQQCSALEVEVRDARILKTKLMNDQQMLGHFRTIDAALNDTDWSMLSTQIAQCLPADAWLDSFQVGQDGQVVLSGGSYSEDGVFEFVRWLSQVPRLVNVAIDGTRPGRFAGGGGMQFDVHGTIATPSELGDSSDDRS